MKFGEDRAKLEHAPLPLHLLWVPIGRGLRGVIPLKTKIPQNGFK